MTVKEFLNHYQPTPSYLGIRLFDYDLDEDGGKSTIKPCYLWGLFTKKQLQDSGRFEDNKIIFFNIDVSENNTIFLDLFIKTIS